MWLVALFCVGLSVVGWTPPAWAEGVLFPDAAPAGATVTISSAEFGEFKSTRENRVLFNGKLALIQRWEPDLISVKVPLRAKTGPVVVLKGHRTIKIGTFTVQQPTITSLNPPEAEPGATLEIRGAHFGNTAGSRDPNTMFGVNGVLISGVPARIQQWRDHRIEVKVPPNAATGGVVVRLASSDPLPDGSCCAPVAYSVSNAMPLKVIPSIRADPTKGPVGTKVVLFGKGFGATRSPGDAILFNGRLATIAQWKDSLIVVHVPLGATSGPLVIKRGQAQRTIGDYEVMVPKVTGFSPTSGPVGSLVRITGENFGFYSESGSTPFAFSDFNIGDNAVEFGGVPGIVYRWHNDKLDVWVPFSAKSGPVVVKRGGTTPKEDGSCCAERGLVTAFVGTFTVMAPRVEAYEPTSAGLDEIVTIKGSGFGNFIKSTEETQSGLGAGGHELRPIRLGENVSRSEVLFNNIAAIVVSWSDTEIKVRVPRRPLFGIGSMNEFSTELATGPLVIRRGSWDLLPDGSCCTPKHWVSVEAGEFTILARGIPDQGYFDDTNPNVYE